ncbi:MAG: DUF3800 domain-containing protein [Candidatus Pacebacteria bacterium]|nr:DUF3800 domain-containing protein [Candidatus Paceibacterota bacterium]
MYIFIDESGQFTKHNNEKYFVVASFTIGDPTRTSKRFRSWMRSRFPRKMRTQSEIKWSSSGISDSLRLRTLKYISSLDVRIRFTFLLRKNIPHKYHKKNGLASGLLYTNVIGEALDDYLPIADDKVLVFCDRRHLKGMAEKEFRGILEARLLTNLSPNSFAQIKMVDSTTSVNVQIADWIAGGLFRYLEDCPLGDECFKILKNNLLGEGKELFNN